MIWKKRIKNALEILDESPLGCGALAGTTHGIEYPPDILLKAIGIW